MKYYRVNMYDFNLLILQRLIYLTWLKMRQYYGLNYDRLFIALSHTIKI